MQMKISQNGSLSCGLRMGDGLNLFNFHRSQESFLSLKVYQMEYQELVDRPCAIDNKQINGVVYTNQKGAIARWHGYEQGEWWIMNPAAVHAVDLAYRAVDKTGTITALDMCAAPGGKTFRLKSHGASVVSMDISRTRLSRLEENAKRLNMDVATL